MKRSGLFHIILASLLLAVPSLSQVAHAQDKSVIAGEQVDPQRLAAARALLEAGDFEQLMSKILQSMMPMMEQAMSAYAERPGAAQLSPKQRKEFREISKLLSKALTDKFQQKLPELTELTLLVYARALTVEELHALTEFQKSPAGRKFTAATPEIMTEIMPNMITAMMTGKPIASNGALDPEKQRAIEEMLETSRFDSTMDLMLEKMAQQTPTGALPPEVSEQTLQEMEAEKKTMIEQFKSRKQELKQYVASAWGKRFEIEEINAVTNFYKTESGQRILTSMPKIIEEQQKLQQKMFSTMFSDMGTMFQDVIRKHQSQQ